MRSTAKRKNRIMNTGKRKIALMLLVVLSFSMPIASAVSEDTSNEAVSIVSNSRITFDNVHKDRQVTWSSDGQWLAFMTTRYGGWSIAKIKRDGTSIAKLTFGLEPTWAPNSRILFSRGPLHYEDVYVMNADGSNISKLTTTPDFDEYPDWSPDGSKIVYSSRGGVIGGRRQIWIMNSDGSGRRRVNTVEGIQPAWSPVGNKIAFKCYLGGYNVCVMNTDGTGLKQVTHNSGNTHEPDWSPDGNNIVYASNKDGDWEIYTIRVDGSGEQKLTNNVVEDNYPAWSPDGQWIAYSSGSSGNEEIWTMKISSSVSTSVTVMSPNGGENWTRGTTKTVKWSYSGNIGPTVKIDLYRGPTFVKTITSSTLAGSSGYGSYNWYIPATQTMASDYKIKVTGGNSAYSDMSNNYFRIY